MDWQYTLGLENLWPHAVVKCGASAYEIGSFSKQKRESALR